MEKTNSKKRFLGDIYPDLIEFFPEEKTVGDFTISHVKLTERQVQSEQAQAMYNGSPSFTWRFTESDVWQVVLSDKQGVWMSDTGMERFTNQDFITRANGDVLVFGLGLGLIIHPVLKKKEVTSVTVVEMNADIIELTTPTFETAEGKDKLKILQGDAHLHEFPTGKKFDTIYFDIWQKICPFNYPETKTLHARYRKNRNYDNPKSSTDSWVRDYIKKEFLEMKKWGKERRSLVGSLDDFVL